MLKSYEFSITAGGSNPGFPILGTLCSSSLHGAVLCTVLCLAASWALPCRWQHNHHHPELWQLNASLGITLRWEYFCKDQVSHLFQNKTNTNSNKNPQAGLSQGWYFMSYKDILFLNIRQLQCPCLGEEKSVICYLVVLDRSFKYQQMCKSNIKNTAFLQGEFSSCRHLHHHFGYLRISESNCDYSELFPLHSNRSREVQSKSHTPSILLGSAEIICEIQFPVSHNWKTCVQKPSKAVFLHYL